MKKELLSPAGNMEALKSAVIHGADAVYVGGKRFGARAFATNFSEEEMKEAIFYCHLYGVKLYVTVNIMIYESELKEVLSYIKFLYENHVDAIIMADLGLMKLCHECFPDLEIHASTQAHTHNVEQISFLQKLGVKRVVLARELSLEEIKRFPDNMEYEIFIHGALCVSYSGQCLFSSLLMGRSGNRGSCAQICRLPFTLLKNGEVFETEGKYLLSLKDLNTSNRFEELMKSNVTSFKIEGRMKSPAYVGYITQMYRTLMDEFNQTRKCYVSSKMGQNAAVLFGRGFTEGKLFQKEGKEFVNQLTSNHQGILLGKVVSISKEKIGIHLECDLHQEDGIRFSEEEKGFIVNFLYNEKGLLISSASKGDTIFVDNKIGLQKKCTVMKTMDTLLEHGVLAQRESKIPLNIFANVSLENGFTLCLSDGAKKVEITRPIVSLAKSYPITKEQVIKQLSKLGNTPFEVKEITALMEDNLFISIKELNELRRDAVEKFIQERVARKNVKFGKESKETFSYNQELEFFATIRNEEQLKTLLPFSLSGIYVDDINLYEKYQNEKVIYRTNRVSHHIHKKSVRELLAGESGSFMTYDVPKHTDYFFNVANHATADALKKMGAERICLSPEFSKEEMKTLLMRYPNGNPFEMILYGRLEVMVLNHCILKTNVNKDSICQVCKKGDLYSLQDRNGKIYPLLLDEEHHTHIFHYKVKNDISEFKDYYDMGIRKFRLEFFDESPEEIKQIIKEIKCTLQV